jgi:hypothetical protein
MRVALLVSVVMGVVAGGAMADSFTPVRLAISVAPVARLHKPLRITVGVSADASVLDNRTAPLRVEVKLANECGGSFETTPGTTLLNEALSPQPSTGRAYSARARGSGRPAAYGQKTACVYLEEEGEDRVFASDQSVVVNISKACTVAAARYDRTGKRKARKAARRACGPGVTL